MTKSDCSGIEIVFPKSGSDSISTQYVKQCQIRFFSKFKQEKQIAEIKKIRSLRYFPKLRAFFDIGEI